ncbi:MULTISPECIES: phage replisome organizer N-terminal domain-containing protein [unclassified Clostridium]
MWIRLGLKTLKDFRMIEVDEDNLIKIINLLKATSGCQICYT